MTWLLGSLVQVQAWGESDLTNADDIVKQANRASYYAGKDGRAEARMKIIDSQKHKQIRQFTILRRTRIDDRTQDMLVFISRPSDVRGMVFRVVRQPGGDDNRWLYLPGLDLVRQISAGDQRTSFIGSDFLYEDVSGRDPNADTHQILETTKKYYKLKSIPKKSRSVEFSYYTSWIDKKTLLPMKVEYTDIRGKIYRRMDVKKVTVIQGYPTVLRASISNLDSNSSTTMEMRGVRYDLGLPASIFSERSLRTPPTSWLRGK